MFARIRNLAVMGLLAVVACAPTTQWERVNTSPSQQAADEKQCLDIAGYQAWDESEKSKPIYPPFRETQFNTDGGGGGEDGGGITTSYSRRGARVYELSEYCMQQRGYHLVPIAKK